MTSLSQDHLRRWEFDAAGSLDAMKKSAYDRLDGVTEGFQNAADSVIPPSIVSDSMSESEINLLPNTIDINVPAVKDPVLWSIQDSGLGIAKDYDYDPIAFLDAKKATSKKAQNRYSGGHKGLGMSQYFLLSNKILFVSCDANHNRTIQQFWLITEKDPNSGKEYAAFTYPPVIRGISPETQKEFGIYKQGTKVIFFKTHDLKDFTISNVIERIVDSFGLRISWSKNLVINCNGKRLTAAQLTPSYMIGHPEHDILTFVHHDGRTVKISGDIYEDKSGSSRLVVIGRGGQKIFESTFGRPKRCSGYLYCNLWEPETGRKLVQRDDVWIASQAKITEYLQKFKDVKYADEEDDVSEANWKKKIKNMVERGIEKALSGLQPPILSSDIQDKIPRQKRDKTEIKKEQKPKPEEHTPRPRRHRKESQIYPIIQDFGKDPLMDIRLNSRPWMLCINTKSPIYPYKMKVKNTREWLDRNAEQMGMIRMKVAEKYGQLDPINSVDEYKRQLEIYTMEALGV